ncbi:MAG: hypothetical protein BWY90_01240 [Deltaproteobacteria bacterium ADurb.BinA014]|nr:MAG: hypothetical protein BWY90_01240 [Deltaproteobacteria bacterium ADurb.BinA014]
MDCLTSSGSVTISCPATIPAPEVGVIIPHSIRMVVDLPEPLEPRKPKISPFFTKKLILFTAVKSPNFFSRLVTEIESELESVMSNFLIHFFYFFDDGLFQRRRLATHGLRLCRLQDN